jgi:hypothetical protein
MPDKKDKEIQTWQMCLKGRAVQVVGSSGELTGTEHNPCQPLALRNPKLEAPQIGAIVSGWEATIILKLIYPIMVRWERFMKFGFQECSSE